MNLSELLLFIILHFESECIFYNLSELFIFVQFGGECIVLPSVSKDDAVKLFPQHRVVELPSGKDYLRLTPQP